MIGIAATVSGVHVILNLLFTLKSGTPIEREKRNYDLPHDIPSVRCAVYATILEKEELDQEHLVNLEPKVLNSFGIPYGDALKIVAHAQNSRPSFRYNFPMDMPSGRCAAYATILQKQELDQEQLCNLKPKVLYSFGIPYGDALKIVAQANIVSRL